MAEILISKYDFEGFPCKEDGNLKQYKEKFQNMLQNLKEQLNNEDTIEEISQDEFLIPKPSEDFHEDKAVEVEEIRYFLVEKGSRKKNDMITDSCGYNYSYWRETGNKKKTKHFRCIKRHTKGKSDCPSILKVINCNEENQEVIRRNEHNHEPDLALNIRRQINIDLKRECMEKIQNVQVKLFTMS